MQDKVKKVAEETMVVILAAGKGSRMGSRYMAKVCFEIDGIPAINRLITTFKKKHFSKFLVVVGSMAEQVLDTVGAKHPNVLFVHQTPQLGTGHAGRIASDTLKKLGFTGPVLLTMGDKYIAGAAVEMLVESFVKQESDLMLLTLPKSRRKETAGGRVFLDTDGRAVCIIEQIDVDRQAIADDLHKRLDKKETVSASDILELSKKHIASSKKMAVAVPELLKLADKKTKISQKKLAEILRLDKYNLQLNGKRYTARQLKRMCKEFNPSLYLCKAKALYKGVSMIDNNNAQNEYYLTDIVKNLNSVTDKKGHRCFEVRTVLAENANVIQGFNSLRQLLSIKED